jgi:hypothetical protein
VTASNRIIGRLLPLLSIGRIVRLALQDLVSKHLVPQATSALWPL